MIHSDGANRVRELVSRSGLIIPYTVGTFLSMDGSRVIKVGRRGVADTLACIDGRFVAIEIKTTDTDRQSADQKKFQKILEDNGGTYIIADFRKGQDGLEAVRHAF
ncbi:MAG: hypothetical protein ACR2QF_05720 [Geminicoccaceae bacterium]